MVLDTNAYSALALGEWQISYAVKDIATLRLPLNVIAELRFGFKNGNRHEYNEQTLQKFLAQPQVSILTPSLKTTLLYADLGRHCRLRGKALSHNDLWIAALCIEAGETLATFDRDFEVFRNMLGDKLIMLESA